SAGLIAGPVPAIHQPALGRFAGEYDLQIAIRMSRAGPAISPLQVAGQSVGRPAVTLALQGGPLRPAQQLFHFLRAHALLQVDRDGFQPLGLEPRPVERDSRLESSPLGFDPAPIHRVYCPPMVTANFSVSSR